MLTTTCAKMICAFPGDGYATATRIVKTALMKLSAKVGRTAGWMAGKTLLSNLRLNTVKASISVLTQRAKYPSNVESTRIEGCIATC
jgi:hypothetical protein